MIFSLSLLKKQYFFLYNKKNKKHNICSFKKKIKLTNSEDYRNLIYYLSNRNNKIRTYRFAPSPTGHLHIGSLYTMYMNIWLAKKKKNLFILRIDDTDKSREYNKFIDEIIILIKYLNINIDNKKYYINNLKNFKLSDCNGEKDFCSCSFFFQSNKFFLYYAIIEKLIKKNLFYICNCKQDDITKRNLENGIKDKFHLNNYDNFCRNKKNKFIFNLSRIRVNTSIFILENQNNKIYFNDLLRGKIFHNDKIIDFIINRTDMGLLYFFASAFDEYINRTKTIVRSEEWLKSTYKNVILQYYINKLFSKNINITDFLHLPIIKNFQNKKLSKRDKNTNILEIIIKDGISSKSIENFILTLLFSYQQVKELKNKKKFSKFFLLKDSIDLFSLKNLKKNSPKYDYEHLKHFNLYYIKNMSIEKLMDELLNFISLKKEYFRKIRKHKILFNKITKSDFFYLISGKKDLFHKIYNNIQINNFIYCLIKNNYNNNFFYFILKKNLKNFINLNYIILFCYKLFVFKSSIKNFFIFRLSMYKILKNFFLHKNININIFMNFNFFFNSSLVLIESVKKYIIKNQIDILDKQNIHIRSLIKNKIISYLRKIILYNKKISDKEIFFIFNTIYRYNMFLELEGLDIFNLLFIDIYKKKCNL